MLYRGILIVNLFTSCCSGLVCVILGYSLLPSVTICHLGSPKVACVSQYYVLLRVIRYNSVTMCYPILFIFNLFTMCDHGSPCVIIDYPVLLLLPCVILGYHFCPVLHRITMVNFFTFCYPGLPCVILGYPVLLSVTMSS